MKIRIKKTFRYQADARTEKALSPGIYAVPGDISDHLARAAIRMGKAELVFEKKSPENKLAEVPENMSKVVKKTKYRRRTRSKSDK